MAHANRPQRNGRLRFVFAIAIILIGLRLNEPFKYFTLSRFDWEFKLVARELAVSPTNSSVVCPPRLLLLRFSLFFLSFFFFLLFLFFFFPFRYSRSIWNDTVKIVNLIKRCYNNGRTRQVRWKKLSPVFPCW